MKIHLPFDEASTASGDLVDVTPDSAGWTYAGLRVIRLATGQSLTMSTGDREFFVVPISGSLRLRVDGPHGSERFALNGRPSVFTHVTDFCYAGRDSGLTLSCDVDVVVALPSASCDTALPPAYVAAADVPVEVRGAGSATRQVTNFGVPGVFDGAERLIACELLTPPGNWSSYPPHKHDVTDPCVVANEEIYYYRIADGGFGVHRTYTGQEHEAAGVASIDVTVAVRDHDVVLVPHGYHGPCVAAPGYAMYYLNVLAGPATPRSMAFCDDQQHAWLRESWLGAETDPRCPMTSATGAVS